MKHRQFLAILVIMVVVLSAWTLLCDDTARSAEPERQLPPPGNTRPPRTDSSTDPAIPLPAKIEPALLKQLWDGEPGDSHRFIVELAHQANLATISQELSRQDRQAQLVDILQATAEQTQAQLLALLETGHAEGRVQEVHPFWIFNGIAVTADAQTLLALAAHPDVRLIREDHWRRWVELAGTQEGRLQPAEDDSEWNIAQVRADMVWSALGLDGSGVTVAIMDTGVDWHHPALIDQYRGYKPGGLSIHEGNWHCTTDEGYLYPVDGYGHGTHVTGIAVGTQNDKDKAMGVAPGARWIAVKMLNNAGFGYDSWIHAAFEWIMAPADDPALAPDVINGSWGSRLSANEAFRPDLQAIRAAGIVPVFAAGNEGPEPSSLHSPGSFQEVLTVGATDDLDQVTSFSGRGPSPWGEIKPDVVAPGAQIRSSLPGGTYAAQNGTSMATPHVAGLVALMLQADPDLTIDEIEAIVASTAQPLGSEVPNNSTGWGRIDAYRAAAVALHAGSVTGEVTRQSDQKPLLTARVTAYDREGQPQAMVQVDDGGHYRLALPPGRYDLKAAAFGYESQTVADHLVQATLTTTLHFQLSPSPAGVLWGQISHAETGGPVGAQITIGGTPAQATSDPQTGQYSISLPAGVYDAQVSQNGYRNHAASGIAIVADGATRLDIALAPAPTLLLVDSGRWYYDSQASYFEQALTERDYAYDRWEIRDLATDVPGIDDLTRYDITVWSSPQDAPGLIGAGDTISDYLRSGGNLFLTGQDVGYWDGGLNPYIWHPYYVELLKAAAIADSAGRNNLEGIPDEILDGLSLVMNPPDSAGNQVFPDVIGLLDSREASIIARYAVGGDAGLRAGECQTFRAVYLAAGLEGLGDRADRAEVMDRSLAWLGSPHPERAVELYPGQKEHVWLTGTFITYTVELRNLGLSSDRYDLELSPSAWPSTVWDDTLSGPITRSLVLGACQTQTLLLKVEVPPDVVWNTTDLVTLTARSLADPTRIAQASFSSKAPAPILLVDGHRWYDTSSSYRNALEANGLPYDHIHARDLLTAPDTQNAMLQRLQRYPVVIWFTAKDWYQTLTPAEEDLLAVYLDAGGRLLLSSQDYLYTSGFTDFAPDYLGVYSFTEGLTTTHTAGALGSPIGDRLGPHDLVYPFRNWSDALRPTADAQIAFWGQHAQPAALTLEQPPWKTAFFAFPLEALQKQEMATVVGRAVNWLSALGDSTLTVDPPVAIQGDELAVTLLVQNTGPELLSQVTLSNTVPPSTTYIPDSLQGPAHYDSLTNRFTWNGSLASGQAITVSYRLRLDSTLPQGTMITNRARLAEESGLAVDRLAATRIDAPNLSTSVKTTSARLAIPSQALTYTLTLRNDGLQPAQASLTDPIPLHTAYTVGSGSASSGQLTSTAEALLWSGIISTGHEVTITFPVVISPAAAGLYVLNRAMLTDLWGNTQPLEAYTWVGMRIFLPLVLKQQH